jgi:hypothetical protein
MNSVDCTGKVKNLLLTISFYENKLYLRCFSKKLFLRDILHVDLIFKIRIRRDDFTIMGS